MWKRTTKWRPARTSGSNPIPVEKVGSENEIGLAKNQQMLSEKLASDLASQVGVKVPKVEFATVEGQQGLYAISHAHGKESIDISALKERFPGAFDSPQVKSALKRASGLVAFYAWIATGDLKDDHLVLDMDSSGEYDVAGIDFQASFQWPAADGGEVEPPNVPSSLVQNIDQAQVGSVVNKIEKMTDEQIRETVNRLPDIVASAQERERLAAGLIGRKSKVQKCMRGKSWQN